MKIRLGPLARIRQERELRHAEDLARDVLDARLPHRTARVRKGAQGESVANGQRWIDLLGFELHFMGEDVDVRGGVVCLARSVEWCVIWWRWTPYRFRCRRGP